MSVDDWTDWRAARERSVSAPFGIASLHATAYLDEEWRRVDGVAGRWRVDGDSIEGDVDDERVRLAPGTDAEIDGVRVRHFVRDRASALRIFDPQSANRTSIVGIDAYPFTPEWRIVGTLEPSPDDAFVDVTAVDGLVTRARLVGTVALFTPEGETRLTVTGDANGRLSAVLGDATNGVETYRFRFLEVHGDEDGTVTVDFNRAYLPPCAFSAEYVCPLPLPGNRWDVPVRAGERGVLRT